MHRNTFIHPEREAQKNITGRRAYGQSQLMRLIQSAKAVRPDCTDRSLKRLVANFKSLTPAMHSRSAVNSHKGA